MADPAPTNTPAPGETPPANTPPAANPPANTPPANNVDLKTLPADQLEAVLENPAFWHLPRVAELRTQAAEAKTLKDKQAADATAALEKNKEFETLANQRKDELEKAKDQNKTMAINQALMTKLAPEGVVDLDAALKLVDRSKLKVDDNGVVEGVDEVVASLKTDKTYLFNKDGTPPNPTLGTPPNPGDAPNTPAKFKRSQLADPKFYSEHRDDILAAAKAGLIEDDITPK